MYKAGKIPHQSEQLPTGSIIIYTNLEEQARKTVLYAQVSSYDQKEELKRQVQRLRDFSAEQGLSIAQEITEVGSALNGKRKKLLRILKDNSITILIVEHRDRLTHVGFEYLEASLQATNRKILVINDTECKDDLVQDMSDIFTLFCAHLHGKRSVKLRAKKALKACQT